MVGYGIRFVALGSGLGVAVGSLMACLAIGFIADVAAERLRLPFAAVAFAGAVPMMPGVPIFQSIAGAMRLAAAGTAADPVVATATLAYFFSAAFVIGAMAIGLLVGARLARWLSALF
jgi:uncharacterized membrane protein YjjB (DUF3815 family)